MDLGYTSLNLCLNVSRLNINNKKTKNKESFSAVLWYLVIVLAVQLAHLAVHQVLDRVDFRLHLFLGGLQLVLQFVDERFTAATIKRSLQQPANINMAAHTTNMSNKLQN